MTTSNSTNFFIDSEECIRMAFEEICVDGEGDGLENYDGNRGRKTLNMMLKHWQSQNHHLWVKQTITMFLQKAQYSYSIYAATSDHFTSDKVVQTMLVASYPLGASTITVNSTTGMTANDKIGIKMDNNYLFWTTIQSIPIAGTIILNSPLTYASAAFSTVFTYATALDFPFQVYSGVRRDYINNIDVPLNYMSYREYSDMPNKSTLGIVTQWAASRLVDNYEIYTWLAPSDVNYYLRFVISRRIQDVDVNSDTFDLPQEWQLAIVKNLAVLLAPSYGKAQGDNFMELKLQAQVTLQEAKCMDNEMGSIFIKPNADGFRRP